MGIVGDIANSRVANGHLIALPDLGVHITLIGPPTLIPESVPPGMAVTDDFDAALPGLDVIYMLRIQKERGANIGFDSEAAYVASFGLDDRRLGLAPKTTVVMHPGPINRGLEITGSVADGTRSLIETQVAMGVPMRMAILAACLGVTP
jgi:aspartate carbamoyltransferase catalytic subunit